LGSSGIFGGSYIEGVSSIFFSSDFGASSTFFGSSVLVSSTFFGASSSVVFSSISSDSSAFLTFEESIRSSSSSSA